MTLNQIVDDILLTCAYVDKERTKKLHRRQVESWIHEYRLLLLKQEVSKNSVIDPTYITYTLLHYNDVAKDELMYTISGSTDHIDRPKNIYSGMSAYDSTEDLPELAPLIGRVGIVSITGYNKEGNATLAPLADISRVMYGRFSRWTGERLTASVYGKKLRLWKFGPPLEKEKMDPSSTDTPDYVYYTKLGVILANPEEYIYLNRDGTPITPEHMVSYKDMEYPMPEDRIPRIKQMIFANELQWVLPARDTQQSSQMAKMEEQELNNNPTTLLQAGAALYGEI